jgi:hydroxyacid-oxoacid transhydrogenase
MPNETAFEIASSSLRFGTGATREVGADLVAMAAKNVLVFTDPHLRTLPPVATALDSLEHHRIRYSLFDQVHVEPSEASLTSTPHGLRTFWIM